MMSLFVATGRRRKAPNLLKASPTALMSGVGMALLVVLTLTFGYQAVYHGRILPGVVVAGMDLSRLDPAEAAARLEQVLAYPQYGPIVFRDGERFWQASPAELGLRLEVQAWVREAYRIGRHGVLRALAEQINAAPGVRRYTSVGRHVRSTAGIPLFAEPGGANQSIVTRGRTALGGDGGRVSPRPSRSLAGCGN